MTSVHEGEGFPADRRAVSIATAQAAAAETAQTGAADNAETARAAAEVEEPAAGAEPVEIPELDEPEELAGAAEAHAEEAEEPEAGTEPADNE